MRLATCAGLLGLTVYAPRRNAPQAKAEVVLADDDDLYAELVGPIFPQPISGVGGAGDAAG